MGRKILARSDAAAAPQHRLTREEAHVSTILVLDPTVDPAPDIIPLAPRPETLSGLCAGLLDNGKPGVARFLDHLERLLAEHHQGMRFVRARKLNASRPAPPATLDQLVADCDVVVSAVGD